MKNGVVRTVRDGRVKIGDHWFRPDPQHLAYDGRLDGMRFLFGRYPAPRSPGRYEPYVSLWGTAEAARDPESDWPGPECVGGSFPWLFWHEEKSR